MPVPEQRLEFTGERFVPGLPGEIEHEHLHRYLVAVDAARGLDVLDAACGEGYGSSLLSTVARTVVGVDISGETVAHAQSTYVRENLEFRVGDCAVKLPLEGGSVDLVVSFETLEHLHDQERFFSEDQARPAPWWGNHPLLSGQGHLLARARESVPPQGAHRAGAARAGGSPL